MFVCAAWAAQHGRSSVRPLGTRLSLEHSFRNSMLVEHMAWRLPARLSALRAARSCSPYHPEERVGCGSWVSTLGRGGGGSCGGGVVGWGGWGGGESSTTTMEDGLGTELSELNWVAGGCSSPGCALKKGDDIVNKGGMGIMVVEVDEGVEGEGRPDGGVAKSELLAPELGVYVLKLGEGINIVGMECGVLCDLLCDLLVGDLSNVIILSEMSGGNSSLLGVPEEEGSGV